jgi:hypothetical protein
VASVLSRGVTRREIMSAGRYLRLLRQNPKSIISAKPVPPQVGRRGDFGRVVVVRRMFPVPEGTWRSPGSGTE